MKAKKFIEDLFKEDDGVDNPRIGRVGYSADLDIATKDLIDHIIAMADDDYLSGHPEWSEIIEEAKRLSNLWHPRGYVRS